MTEPRVPARIKAIAEEIGDEPLSWREHPNGDVTIVFANKGKQTFRLESVSKEKGSWKEAKGVIETKADAEAAVKNLPKRRKEKQDGTE